MDRLDRMKKFNKMELNYKMHNLIDRSGCEGGRAEKIILPDSPKPNSALRVFYYF